MTKSLKCTDNFVSFVLFSWIAFLYNSITAMIRGTLRVSCISCSGHQAIMTVFDAIWRIISVNSGWSPHSQSAVIWTWDYHFWVDRIPGYTVYSFWMSSQFGYGVFTVNMINVDFGILTSRGNKGVFGAAAKTTVNGVFALGDASVMTDKALFFNTP